MTLQSGDFTTLAEDYAKHRPGYSLPILKALLELVGPPGPGFRVADVGAGTGIWTRMLASQGIPVEAVEPNEAMRAQGERDTRVPGIRWHHGSAEATGLGSASLDWVTMASSFHWARQPDGLRELARILKPGGHLTVLWNPRDSAANPFNARVERLIEARLPDLKRISSGAPQHARDYAVELLSTGDFQDVTFLEGTHWVDMSRERYLGVWRSVNDIQSQAGPERFQELLQAIEREMEDLRAVRVHYKTRAWTAQRR